MILYILHVTVITTICFLFYKLLLQKETFYHLNRWILMGCLAVSFGLPLLPVPREFSWRDKWEEQTVRQDARFAQTGAETKALPKTSEVRSSTVDASPTDAPGKADDVVAQTGDKSEGIVALTAEHSWSAAIGKGASSTSQNGTATQKDVKSRQMGEAGRSLHDSKTGRMSGQNEGVRRDSKVMSMSGQSAEASRESRSMSRSGQTGTALREGKSVSMSGQNETASRESKSMSLPVQNEAASQHGKLMRQPVVEQQGGESMPLFFVVVKWVFYGYLFGLLLFGANFLLQIAVLLYQSYSRPVIQDGRFRIVEIRGNRAPCSFGNTIFINPENYDWETYNQILIHEKIHVSGRHTLDILLAEIAVVLQWFNPFVWLYRREVENNLEFLTDASVLQHREVERSAYQLSLLRVSAPHLPFSITNNYNQSLLKRRIVMMNSKRSSSHTVWKYFFLLPILSVLVCALNKPAAFAATEKSSAPGHQILPGVNTDPGGSSARPVSPLKFPATLVSVMSVFADTTIQPASGVSRSSSPNASSAKDSSSGSGSSMGAGYSHDYGDGGITQAALQAQADAYFQLQQNYQQATAQKVAMHLDIKQQELMATDLQLKIVNGNAVHVEPVMNVRENFNVAPMVNVNLAGLQIMADTDLREGAWFATMSDDKLSFELKSGDDDHNWSSSLHVEKSEINPFPGQGNVEFKLVREAGTMTFKGQFDGEEGFGHFRFTPDAGYLAAIKQMGVEDVDERREFAYFSVNIKKDYVNMLVHNGYPHISQRDLISFAALKIDKGFIQDWRGSGFDDADNPRNLVSLKAMKIDRAYVDELKAAGYDHLNIHELMSMKAQHIDRVYIRSLGRNSDSPIPVHELISYKAMHIDSGYLEGLRKVGYENLPRNEVTSLYAMHVTPEYIKSLQDLGYKDIPLRDLTSLKAMDVTPDYIKGFRDIGYKDLPLRQLSAFKSMHITPEYVKQFEAIGYKDLETHQLTSFMAMGVTPEFVKSFRDLGYTDLSANELGSLKAMNITPDFVAAFNKIGFGHIPVHVLTSLKATGVDAEYVSKMKEKGFISNDLNKYIRLKNDFN